MYRLHVECLCLLSIRGVNCSECSVEVVRPDNHGLSTVSVVRRAILFDVRHTQLIRCALRLHQQAFLILLRYAEVALWRNHCRCSCLRICGTSESVQWSIYACVVRSAMA